MFLPFLVLTILGAVVLVAGSAWMLITWGKTTRSSGPEVGAEIMGSLAAGDAETGITLAEKSAFVGTGAAVSREVEISYAEIKHMLRPENRRAALPVLLAVGGLFAFIVFGAITLWLALDDKLIATLIAVPALFTMGRIARDILRA
jgi:hypothetical protein